MKTSSNKKMSRWSRLIAATTMVAAASGASGCSKSSDGAPPSGSLLASDGDADAEALRLKQMQTLRVVSADDGNVTEEWDLDETSFYNILRAVLNRDPDDECHPGTMSDGEYAVCYARWTLDLRRLVLAAARDLQPIEGVKSDDDFGNGVVLPSGEIAYDAPIVIPPQSAATRAAMAQWAVDLMPTTWAIWAIDDDIVDSGNAAYLEELATIMRETAVVISEAAAFAAEQSGSVGDAQRGSTSDRSAALARQWTGESLSREAAARILVSGDPDEDSECLAACTEPSSQPGVDKAKEVIRAFGPSRQYLEYYDGLLTSPNSETYMGHVVGADRTYLGEPNFGSKFRSKYASVDDFLEFFELNQLDFIEAFIQLSEEARRFDRTSVLLPESTDDFPVYSTVHSHPSVLPDVFYQTQLVRNGGAQVDLSTGVFNYGNYLESRRAVSSDHSENALGALNSLNKEMEHVMGAMPSGTDFNRARSILAGAIAESPVQGTLVHCATGGEFVRDAYTYGPRSYRIENTAWLEMTGGVDNVGSLLLVRGTDGLRCALGGEIEGADCDLSDFVVNEPFQEQTHTHADGHETVYATADFEMAHSGNWQSWDTEFDVFLLKGPEAFSFDASTSNEEIDALKGRVTSITGFHFFPERVSTSNSDVRLRCDEMPISPEFSRMAAGFVRPSTRNCSRPEVSCAGGVFDQRLALENELSEDGDGVESSWRYYLGKAKEAAAEADRLADNYVASNLSLDQKIESDEDKAQAQRESAAQRLDELQEICGTAVDPMKLVELMFDATRDTGGAEDYVQGSTCTNNDGLADGYVCVAGQVIRDWKALARQRRNEPGMKELVSCVEQFEDYADHIHLADTGICVWQGEAEYCQGTPQTDAEGNSLSVQEAADLAEERCPQAAAPEGTGWVCPDNMILIDDDAGLGWFNLSDREPPPLPRNLCESVRSLRQVSWGSVPKHEALEEIRESGIYSSTALASIRSQIEYRAQYGGYVDVALNGESWFSTGSTGSGFEHGVWPCKGDDGEGNMTVRPPRPDDCHNNPTSMFCQSIDCSSRTERTHFNKRIFDALYALEGASGADGETHLRFRVPSYMHRRFFPLGAGQSPQLVRVDDSFESIWTRTSEKFQTFSRPAGIPEEAEVLRAFFVPSSSGGWSTRWLDNGDYRFATVLVKGGLSEKSTWAYNHVFGGLAGSNDSEGYLLNYFENGEHHDALRKIGDSVLDSFSGGLWHGHTFLNDNVDKNETFCRFMNRKPDGNKKSRRTRQEIVDRYANYGAFWDVYREYSSSPNYLSICQGYLPRESYYPLIGEEGVDLETSGGGQALLDAFELVCAANTVNDSSPVSCAQPPQVRSVRDLNTLAGFLECKADQIAYKSSAMLFKNFPMQVIEELEQNSEATTISGDRGQAISELRSAMRVIADSGDNWRRIFRGFASEVRGLRARLSRENKEDELSGIRFQSTVADRMTSCAVSVASIMDSGIFGIAGGVAAAGATCANAGLQTTFAAQVRDIEQQINQLDREVIYSEAEREFVRLEGEMATQSADFTESGERIQRALGRLDSLRKRANRVVNQAIWQLSYRNAKSASIYNSLSSTALTSQERYLRAHNNAKRWAFLAKRAIEMRLGVDLSTMTDDLPLVESPSSWVDGVCTTSAISYEEISGAADGTGGGGTVTQRDEPLSYADTYIGDYVTKLENLVESYRLEYGFQEGKDRVVVSVRDDAQRVKSECLAESPNLLFHSSDVGFAAESLTSLEYDVWSIQGCRAPATDACDPMNQDEPLEPDEELLGCGLGTTGYCVTAIPAGGISSASAGVDQAAPGIELVFGDDEGCTTQDCRWQLGARVTQMARLRPGTYRFSWFMSPDNEVGAESVGGVWVDGEEFTGSAVEEMPAVSGPSGVVVWERKYFTFTINAESDVEVGFHRPDGQSWDSAIVGAPMLESILAADVANEPHPHVANGETQEYLDPNCPDYNGVGFRENWDYACEVLCPEGFSQGCVEDGRKRCYWETSFDVSQRQIELGYAFPEAGFATGSFNYRLENASLNFVGSGVRGCSEAESVAGCYGSGFLKYSLYHDGPHMIRNHFGHDYQALLFPGVIEDAKGLASERYITNPISSSDLGLLDSYWRSEFQGRPMDGRYTIRLWDDGVTDFSRLEDVQVILDYRYWTRQQ